MPPSKLELLWCVLVLVAEEQLIGSVAFLNTVFLQRTRSSQKYLNTHDPPSHSFTHNWSLVHVKKENTANFHLPPDKAGAGWLPAFSG